MPVSNRGEDRPWINRFAIIGDVHGEHETLEAALRFLTQNGPFDALLCTGDLPAKLGIGDTARCCELLQRHGVHTIRGNHDRWACDFADDAFLRGLNDERSLSQETLAFLGTLPRTREFETPLGSLLLCHGIGDNDMDGIYPGGDNESIRAVLKSRSVYGWYRVMVAGHTHTRMVRRVGTVLILNPGTLLWDKDPGFLVIDFEEGTSTEFRIVPFIGTITESETVSLPLLT